MTENDDFLTESLNSICGCGSVCGFFENMIYVPVTLLFKFNTYLIELIITGKYARYIQCAIIPKF